MFPYLRDRNTLLTPVSKTKKLIYAHINLDSNYTQKSKQSVCRVNLLYTKYILMVKKIIKNKIAYFRSKLHHELGRQKWQPTLVFLPGKFHGQRSLASYSPMSHRVRHDWATKHHYHELEVNTKRTFTSLYIYKASSQISWNVKSSGPYKALLRTKLVEVREFQLSYFKSWKMMLWKCCTQYASKFGKLSSGHRTGKGQFSFQPQRKAMPKNAQTTAQLHSPHILAK